MDCDRLQHDARGGGLPPDLEEGCAVWVLATIPGSRGVCLVCMLRQAVDKREGRVFKQNLPALYVVGCVAATEIPSRRRQLWDGGPFLRLISSVC